MHLIPILDVDVGSSNIPQNIILHETSVGTMDDDPSLLGVFDCVAPEETIGTILGLVKVKAILSLDACSNQKR